MPNLPKATFTSIPPTPSRKRHNIIKRDYLKVWWRNHHFIWDNRNKWVVVGHRTKRQLLYRYHYFGPFNIIVSRCSVNLNAETDIWLRLRWGSRGVEGEAKTGLGAAMTGRLWRIT